MRDRAKLANFSNAGKRRVSMHKERTGVVAVVNVVRVVAVVSVVSKRC